MISPGTGPTGFTKTGLGTLILDGANTYTGVTLVSAGALLINGNASAATGTVTVASGATLGGVGVVGGAATVAAGAFVTPGATDSGRGLLTFNAGLALNGTASLQINSAGARGVAYDSIDVAGGALTGTGSVVLDFAGLLDHGALLDMFGGASFAGLPSGLASISATGTYSGVFNFSAGTYSLVSGAQTLNIDAATGDLSVIGTAIPEPSACAVISGLMAMAGAGLRRRRRSARA